MNNTKQYTAFKNALAKKIKETTGMITQTNVIEDEEYISYKLTEVETPHSSVTALYGYYLAKGGDEEAWQAMFDKAINELSIFPIQMECFEGMEEAGMSKDDILPVIFPKVINSSQNEDIMDLIAHRNVYDVTICYLIAFAHRLDGMPLISSYVTYECMEYFDMSEEELYEASLENIGRIKFSGSPINDTCIMVSAADNASFPASVLAYLPGGLDGAVQLLKTDKAYVVPVSDKVTMIVKPEEKITHVDLQRELKKQHKKCFAGNVISDEVYLYDQGKLKFIR